MTSIIWSNISELYADLRLAVSFCPVKVGSTQEDSGLGS
jgi:hypothetical protein